MSSGRSTHDRTSANRAASSRREGRGSPAPFSFLFSSSSFFPRTKEKRRRLSTPPLTSQKREILRQRARHVIEGRVQLVADVAHRGDGGNGDQRGDEAI